MSAKRCVVMWGLAMMKLSTSNLVIAIVIAFGLQMPFAVTIKGQDNSIIDPVMIPLVEERGGPECLNRFSASISGASARVRLPSGEAAA